MTVPAISPYKAGPFTGNGSSTTFNFGFKVFRQQDAAVILTEIATGLSQVLTLDSDYSIALNANQNVAPGGAVTYPISGSPMANTHRLTVVSALVIEQLTDLANGGAFYPEVIEDALDRAVMLIGQQQEQLDRSLKFPAVDEPGASEIPPVAQRAGRFLVFENNGAPLAGPLVGNVNTVAGAIAAIDTVAPHVAAIETVASNITDVTNFAEVYYGPSAADPSTRRDGSPLQNGDLYFNTTSQRLRVYSTTAGVWLEGNAGNITVHTFSGDGLETDFTLPVAPQYESNTQVYISGVYQQKSEYSISGTTLSFSTAPLLGTDNVEVVVMSVLPLGSTDASFVSYLPASTGAVATDVQTKLRTMQSVMDFIPKSQHAAIRAGTSVYDCTADIRRAILSESPLLWEKGRYRTTEEISEAISHQIMWRSEGAVIWYDPPAETQNVIRLTVTPHFHTIRGLLKIECNKNAFNGIALTCPAENLGTYPEGYPDLLAEDLRVYRPYRSSTAFTGGNAILITGGWNNVILKRPHAVECLMAAGAHVPGEQGIFGISVMRIGSDTIATPHNIVIEDPFIDVVKSEDDNLQEDQDGIRVYTSYNEGGVGSNGTEYTYTVRGGVIRNCRNRSIKGQSDLGRVNDVTFVRTSSLGGAFRGLNAEINEQIGGVASSGCEFFYEDYVPNSLYSSRSRADGFKQVSTTITNLRGVVTGPNSLNALFLYNNEPTAAAMHRVNISNVDFIGASDLLLQLESSAVAPVALNFININNVTCNLLSRAIRSYGGAGKFRINMTGVVNIASTPVPLAVDTDVWSSDKNISCANVIGFTEDARRYSPSTGFFGAFQSTAGLIPENKSAVAGVFRPISFFLADSASFQLPINSTASSGMSGLALVVVSQAVSGAQAIFTIGSAAVDLVSSSSSWQTGTTSEPVSGDYRAWIDSVTGQLTISNRSGGSRTFTVWMLG